MRRKISKGDRNVLSAKRVAALQEPGLYADGGNLYLKIGQEGGKSWVFRYLADGRRRYMGLGPLVDVSLAEARELAADCRRTARAGLDPLDERSRRRQEARREASKAVTFAKCAKDYITAKSEGWSAKHTSQWTNTLATYAEPVIGRLPVADVDLDEVLKVLQPIWSSKTETANRVRGRIEAVLDWATVRGYRSGDNPARWQGNLDHMLAAPAKVTPKQHLAAMPYQELPDFITELQERKGAAARALEFTILTAARTSEVIRAQRDEFDLDAAIWTIPAARMKSGREHRIPLSERAVDLVRELEVVGNPWVFPGHRKGSHLSNMAMLTLLQKRMGKAGLTVHGFRSSFRDWTAEQTAYPNEVAEMALAHIIGDKTEKAYRRGDLFDKRRRMMIDWASYLAAENGSDVAPIRAAAGS